MFSTHFFQFSNIYILLVSLLLAWGKCIFSLWYLLTNWWHNQKSLCYWIDSKQFFVIWLCCFKRNIIHYSVYHLLHIWWSLVNQLKIIDSSSLVKMILFMKKDLSYIELIMQQKKHVNPFSNWMIKRKWKTTVSGNSHYWISASEHSSLLDMHMFVKNKIYTKRKEFQHWKLNI